MGDTNSQTPIDFELSWLANCQVNLRATEHIAAHLSSSAPFNSNSSCGLKSYTKIEWAIKALNLTDLTTLAGDDTNSNVERLCLQAAYPFSSNLMIEYQKKMNISQLDDLVDELRTAAVCVYPSRVKDAYEKLSKLNRLNKIQIAAVATGFPSGQYSLESRIKEIEFAISSGATEIDIVLDRSLVLTGNWAELYKELVSMRLACGSTVHMKSILAIGECGTMENVYKASMVAMMAGSDFIKTSTGKESVNATLTVGLVMIHAIQDFYQRTGRSIGLKPAGGVRTVTDAIAWMRMIQNTLGDRWLVPELFRFGASGILDNIVDVVKNELIKIPTLNKIVAVDGRKNDDEFANNILDTDFLSYSILVPKYNILNSKYLDLNVTILDQIKKFKSEKC